MRKLLWKKAAITAMAGTMMMMTGCELQGAVNKIRIKRHPQQQQYRRAKQRSHLQIHSRQV